MIAKIGNKRNPFEKVWTCPKHTSYGVHEEKFFYASWCPTRKKEGMLKRRWMEPARMGLNKYNVSKDLVQGRLEWRNKIHVPDLNIVRTKLW